jgi:DNA-binding ferritin-like protein
MNVSVEILRRQLSSTIALNAQVQRAGMHFSNQHKPVAELLTCVSRELCALSTLLNDRAEAFGRKDGRSAQHVDAMESSSEADDDDVGLHALLNRFCQYARVTASRRAIAEQGADMDTVRLLDRILSLVIEGVWFLDVYSNALSIKCALTLLPAWRPTSGAVHRVA